MLLGDWDRNLRHHCHQLNWEKKSIVWVKLVLQVEGEKISTERTILSET